ncbi:MAG: 2-C-methyl-D-erythritol 2,4-cyclodiphosphate synthase [Malacoplasma sp.]|nr:2-C-methyl-D-erythritol 2,4-cyclodiphosphate synthase [Malacoplasma sp.]
MSAMRIGNGIDHHQLIKSECEQNLGGLSFKLNYQIQAFSDGDVILHSISSAILGALSESDLGTFFPDFKKENQNLDSKTILNKCLQMMVQKNFEIVNVDITIVCESIYFAPIILQIKKNLITLLKTQNISVKATRFEKESDMISTYCVLLLKSK